MPSDIIVSGNDSPARHRLAGEALLPTDDHGQSTPDDEEEQAHEQELDADDLVIGREYVLPDERLARARARCARPVWLIDAMVSPT